MIWIHVVKTFRFIWIKTILSLNSRIVLVTFFENVNKSPLNIHLKVSLYKLFDIGNLKKKLLDILQITKNNVLLFLNTWKRQVRLTLSWTMASMWHSDWLRRLPTGVWMTWFALVGDHTRCKAILHMASWEKMASVGYKMQQ